MPKALELTDDLTALGREAQTAERALEEAARTGGDVDAARASYLAAAEALRVHPLLEQARVEGCFAQTFQAVKDAVRENAAA